MLRDVERYGVAHRSRFNLAPLMIEARLGNATLVEALRDRGAELDQRDQHRYLLKVDDDQQERLAAFCASMRGAHDRPANAGGAGSPHMRVAADLVTRFGAGRQRANLDADEMHRFAVVRAIETIREAASRVSGQTRNAHPEIPFPQPACGELKTPLKNPPGRPRSDDSPPASTRRARRRGLGAWS